MNYVMSNNMTEKFNRMKARWVIFQEIKWKSVNVTRLQNYASAKSGKIHAIISVDRKDLTGFNT